MADFLQPILPPLRRGHSASAPQLTNYLDSPPSSWKVPGGNIKQKILPGDTLWVVGLLDSDITEGSTPAAWTLVARIEVEKARYVPYKAQLIKPGPSSRWFPPADLTDVIAKLHRVLDERDETGISPKAPPPAPAPAPVAPPKPLTLEDQKEMFRRLLESASQLEASPPPPSRPPRPPREGSLGGITRYSGHQILAAAPKRPPAVPTSGMTNSLRYSLKINAPYLSCLVDAEPLRQWAEQLAMGQGGDG